MEMGLTNQLAAHFARHDPHEIIRGILIATFSFAAMGTITPVWRNPFFTRMTPIEGWELQSLFMFASLAGYLPRSGSQAVRPKRPGLAASRRSWESPVPPATRS